MISLFAKNTIHSIEIAGKTYTLILWPIEGDVCNFQVIEGSIGVTNPNIIASVIIDAYGSTFEKGLAAMNKILSEFSLTDSDPGSGSGSVWLDELWAKVFNLKLVVVDGKLRVQ